MKKVSLYSHADLRLSLKFTSSNHCLNLEMQQEAPSQRPPHKDPSRARELPSNQRLLSTLSPLPNPHLTATLRVTACPVGSTAQEASGSRHEKMNHKHKSTQESCSSDNYPKHTFSDNYRAKNGSTLKIPSLLPRKLRRWFNNNQLLRCFTFWGVYKMSSKKFLGRYSSQKVVMLTKSINPLHRPQHVLTAWESELRSPFKMSQERGGPGLPAL